MVLNLTYAGLRGYNLAKATVYMVIKMSKYNSIRITEKYPSGKTRLRYFVDQNGIKHGVYEHWRENGMLAERCVYNHGKKDGNYYLWDEKFSLLAYGAYKNDEYDGQWHIAVPGTDILRQETYSNGVLIMGKLISISDWIAEKQMTARTK